MNEHVTAWIAAYHDGELGGAQRKKVEAHIQTCAACRSELEALQALSKLLQEAPALPEEALPERFVSQVKLRIGAQPPKPFWQRSLRTSWWLAPAGVIGMWAFGQAVLLVGGFLILLLPALGHPSGLAVLRGAAFWWKVDGGLALILAFNLGLSLFTAVLLGGWLASWWAAQRQKQLEHASSSAPASIIEPKKEN